MKHLLQTEVTDRHRARIILSEWWIISLTSVHFEVKLDIVEGIYRNIQTLPRRIRSCIVCGTPARRTPFKAASAKAAKRKALLISDDVILLAVVRST